MPKLPLEKTLRNTLTTLFILVLAATPWSAALADDGPSEKDVAQPTFFVDTSDGGDDPFHAGCHWHYRDRVCSAAKMFFSGDYCEGNVLFEWTNTRCHEAEDDKRRYDCAEECKRKGLTGTCVEVPNHCGRALDSAACECRKES